MSVWPLLDLDVQLALGTPADAVYDTARYGQDVYGGQPDRPWLTVRCDCSGVDLTRTMTRDPVLTLLPNPSTITLTLVDPDGRYDPDNQNGPHYGLLGPRLPVRVLALGQPVFVGIADAIGHDRAARTTTIVGSGLGSLFASVFLADSARPAESSVERVTYLHGIARAGHQLCPPLVITGTGASLTPVTFDGDTWTALTATAQADRALMYVDAAGTLRYEADWDRRAQTPVARIGCPHRTDVDAHAHGWPTAADRDLLVNVATARAVGIDGETDQVATTTDTQSVSRYGPATVDVSLPLSTVDLQRWTDQAVRLGAFPRPRVESLRRTVHGTEPDAADELAVWWALDVADQIQWVGHDGSTRNLAVIGVQHTVDDTGMYSGVLTLGRPLEGGGYNDQDSRYNQLAYA